MNVKRKKVCLAKNETKLSSIPFTSEGVVLMVHCFASPRVDCFLTRTKGIHLHQILTPCDQKGLILQQLKSVLSCCRRSSWTQEDLQDRRLACSLGLFTVFVAPSWSELPG